MKKHSRIGLILLLAAVIGYFAVLKPQIGLFADRALKVKALDTEAVSYRQRLKDIADIKAEDEKEGGTDIVSTLKAMYLALPRSSQIPETLVMIESIAGSAGVILSSATIGTPSDSQVPISLAFSGNAAEVTKFLDAVYANVRTATIRNQSISADDNGSLNIIVNFGLVYQGDSL